jgi:hypothetical protein
MDYASLGLRLIVVDENAQAFLYAPLLPDIAVSGLICFHTEAIETLTSTGILSFLQGICYSET